MALRDDPAAARAAPVCDEPAPMPQPEHRERRLEDPGPLDLSRRDAVAIAIRAARESIDDNIPALASAMAYHAFLAIPSACLLGLGVFGLAASPATVDSLLGQLRGGVPPDALALVGKSLHRVTANTGGSVFMVILGALLALWTVLGSMTTLMWALNIAYERRETRSFPKQRVTAIAMFTFVLLATALTVGLLVLGPFVSGWVGGALGMRSLVDWLWWVAQWPVEVAGLLVAFAGILYLGPNVDHPRWRFVTPGSVFAVVAWLALSGAFAVYLQIAGGYVRTWGTLSTVVVVLTWLWLSSLALLVGAEINAEAERSRELRRGEPAEQRIRAPLRG